DLERRREVARHRVEDVPAAERRGLERELAADDELLDEHGCRRGGRRAAQPALQIGERVDAERALRARARRWLDHHGPAERARERERFVGAGRETVARTRQAV